MGVIKAIAFALWGYFSAGVLKVANGGTGLSALGTGVATALGINVGFVGGVVTNGGALGTPSSGTLSSCTGLPISTGVSGLGTGAATALGNATNGASGVVVLDGSSKLPAVDGSQLTNLPGGGIAPSTTSERFEEFTDSGFTTGNGLFIGPFGMGGIASGTGASVNYANVDGTDQGNCALLNGTATNSYAGIASRSNGCVMLGAGTFTYETRIYISALSDATDTYTLRIGLNDTSTGTDGVDAVMFRYTHGTNSGQWVLVARQNSTETTTNSSSAPVAGTWYRLKFVVNSAATSVTFYVNDVSVGTVASNIPSGTARATAYGIWNTRTSGTSNSRTLNVDYIYQKIAFTTPR